MRKEKIDEIKKSFAELKTLYMEKLKSIENTFLTVQTYKCVLNNGHTIKREKILKGKKDGSAAIIFPITEDNEVLLAIEPRVFTNKTVDIGFPSGYIEENEIPEISAIRELEEETGYTSDDLIYLGSFYQDQGCSGAYNYYYLAKNCRKVKEQKLDKDEFIKYVLVTFEELEELLEKGFITGLNSAYAIEKGKSYIKEMLI